MEENVLLTHRMVTGASSLNQLSDCISLKVILK